MSDDEFLRGFLDCTLDASRFGHRQHLRAAWLLLRRYGSDEGCERFVVAIKRFVARNDARSKYHETLTRTWLAAVEDALIAVESVDDFDEFLELRPELLDPKHPELHYSPDLLWSDAARRELVEPDRQPFPPHVSAGRL
jgi:hypothetical protein